MSTPFVSFKGVKASVSMLQVLEHYQLLDTLKRRGTDSLTGPCPIHQGSNKTQFRVSLTKNCWNCFGGCDGGNVLDFVVAMEGVDVRKAALLLTEWFGVESNVHRNTSDSRSTTSVRRPQKQPLEEATARCVAEPATMSPTLEENGKNPPLRFTGLKDLDATHPYLAKKGFSRELMEAFGVGYCRKGIMKERIVIPIHNDEGALVAYAGRIPDDRVPMEGRYKYPEGFERHWELYNCHRAIPAVSANGFGLVIVEDFFDVFRLAQAGCQGAVAIMAQSVSAWQQQCLLTTLGRNALMTLVMAQGSGLADTTVRLAQNFTVRLIVCQPQLMTVEEVRAMLEQRR